MSRHVGQTRPRCFGLYCETCDETFPCYEEIERLQKVDVAASRALAGLRSGAATANEYLTPGAIAQDAPFASIEFAIGVLERELGEHRQNCASQSYGSCTPEAAEECELLHDEDGNHRCDCGLSAALGEQPV